MATEAALDQASIVGGSLVEWNGQLGVIQSVDGNRLSVRFDSGENQYFTRQSGVLQRVQFEPGSQVQMIGDPQVGVVLGAVPESHVPLWRVAFPGRVTTSPESSLRPAVIVDPLERMKRGVLDTASEFNLRSVAEDYWTAHLHNALVSLAHARVDLKPYQVSVVHRVISRYPHRFMLCDEVGLGKTIEAAMILKELRARGQAARTLILTPAGLMRQWQFELKTKFNESFAIYSSLTLRHLRDKGVSNPWTDHDSVIASHTWASYNNRRIEEIASVDWDLVIVDEAHHARVNPNGTRTQLFKLVQELIARKEYGRRAALLVTATPLQLHRAELYSLVEMLDPVLFASQADFESHIHSLGGLNRTVELLERGDLIRRKSDMSDVLHDVARFLEVSTTEAEALIENEGALEVASMLRDRHRLSEVLIRNRKAVLDGFQPRNAHRWKVELSEQEQTVHRRMEVILAEGFRVAEETNEHAVGFLMVTWQKLLSSSSQALLTSLRKRRERNHTGAKKGGLGLDEAELEFANDSEASAIVSQLAAPVGRHDEGLDEVISLLEQAGPDTKALVLCDGVREILQEEADAKVLIFTEFRETQEMLADMLADLGTVNMFHGQMKAEAKDRAVESFRDRTGPQFLVSTEAGGEGRNFQFCHFVVNYDLPWNPMKVEQRIGRVDRIGQEHPITIFNLYVEGTIEGRILDVLDRRIKIFEEAVGGLDPILGDTESDIRAALRLAEAKRDEALEALGKRLQEKIQEAKAAEEKLHDFIMQDKSYSAEIAQMALQQEAPITQSEFERFLIELLKSVNTYLYRPEPNGERRVVFHAPFSVEYRALLNGEEARRVCFNPKQNVDSQEVEYLGFGHPIVDAIVKRVTDHRYEGSAAVRSLRDEDVRPGWQFNWLMKVGGVSPKAFVFPVFVDDGGQLDVDEGRRLLLLSRDFGPENSSDQPSLATLELASSVAQGAAIVRQQDEVEQARLLAEQRADVEENRLRALMNHRSQAVRDRINACTGTLERLEASNDSLRMRAVPLWQANLARAEAEMESVKNDFESAMLELNQRRSPTAEFALLNVARIEQAST